MLKALVSFVIGLAVLVAILAALGWGVQNTHVTSFRVTGAHPDQGLVLDGTLALENPSHLPIPIRGVPYTISSDGGVLSTGIVDGTVLRPGSSETNATMRLNQGSVLTLMRTRSSELTINGTVRFALPFVPDLPFSTTYDPVAALRGSNEATSARTSGSNDGSANPIGGLPGGLV